MRQLLLISLFLGLLVASRAEDLPRAATPDEIILFKEALKNTTQDPERWAYTETTSIKMSLRKGAKPPEDTVVRFDPSKPYAKQFTPLKIEGRDPTEKEIRKYREKGEKRGEGIARAAARAADPELAATPETPAKSSRKKRDTEIKPDTDHPRVARDDGDRIVYDVPLISSDKDVPVEKFEVLAVINKQTRQVEHASMRIKESFRMKLVAKVKAGEGSIDFTVVDPKYGPVMTSASGNFGASLLFVPVNAKFATTRTDFQRVKPYSERLQVKLGPLELLDFK